MLHYHADYVSNDSCLFHRRHYLYLTELAQLGYVTLPFVHIYITDHTPDTSLPGHNRHLLSLYAKAKTMGIDSIRYDIRWQVVEPTPGRFDQQAFHRYRLSAELMRLAGLQPPTLVFSTVPLWAKTLYIQHPDQFFLAYTRYLRAIHKLFTHPKKTFNIGRIQVLNEINNTHYTPIDPRDLPRLCDSTRQVFPGIPLVGTILIGNLLTATGTGMAALTYVRQEKQRLIDNFDHLAIDYYPGVWHWPRVRLSLRRSTLLRDIYTQVQPLLDVCTELATWEKTDGTPLSYEIGEMGLPSRRPFGSLRRQIFFYTTYGGALRNLCQSLTAAGIRPPQRVGIYSLTDDIPTSWQARLLRWCGWPEYDWGIFDSRGNAKPALAAVTSAVRLLH